MSKIKRILVVRNNPRKLHESHLNELERHFLKEFDGHDIEIRWEDLYRDKHFPLITEEFLEYLLTQDKSLFEKKYQIMYKKKLAMANDFAWADKILIVSPYWTGLFPSRLKDWMDLLPVEDVTIFTSKDGKTQTGKDTGKEVVLLQTSGDDPKRNNISDSGKILVKEFMRYYGVNKFEQILAHSSYMENYDDKDVKDRLVKLASKWIEETNA